MRTLLISLLLLHILFITGYTRQENHVKISQYHLRPSEITTYPLSPRTPAEWEELQGILITWTNIPDIDHVSNVSDVYVEIVRIPMPPYPETGAYFGHNGEYPSYINSMIINRRVLVPLFHPQYDSTALRIYQEQMPGYKIVGIPSSHLIPMGGAIHCLVKEIAAHTPIFISHAPLPNQTDITDGYLIKACIKSKIGIDYAAVMWHTKSMNQPYHLELKNAGNDTFYAKIPRQLAGKTVKYYLTAKDYLGKQISKPFTAPAGYWQFQVDYPAKISDSHNENAREFQLMQNFPNPFNEETTIQFELKQTSHTRLIIYNATGQCVRRLNDEVREPGLHTLKWNATDDWGNVVSSGVYYYSLHTANQCQRKKLVFLK